ncbi:GIY-YIG nuclease family protein [Streptomyces europaeiscabiei]|uniref:GIY-YIG nuclease family protein n=1 Tax=Streptomyces europaeiscabiei TaxID=146819 RepID=UPI0029BBF4A1|nr:GIY-YIG nuclease family protein [Streptomyces europaeiscabiei]MDX3714381.1 GIY-YIG nuclease family protein [Streptomyces europaeiscabiei]
MSTPAEHSRLLPFDASSSGPWPAPSEPVTYWFIDGDGQALYVGSTANLRRRVSEHERKVWHPRATELRWICCATRAQAFRLEGQLIERLAPAFNGRNVAWEELTLPDLELVAHRARVQKNKADKVLQEAEAFMDVIRHFGHPETATLREVFGDSARDVWPHVAGPEGNSHG